MVLIGPAAANAGIACRSVEGSYDEHAVVGPDCASAVGLCIAGTYRGGIRGPFEGRAASISDTNDDAVKAFTSDSTIAASVGGRRGTLIIKNAGAFTANPDGSIVDLQAIVGGTGELEGATGTLRASGTFSFADGGRSQWQGTICLG